MDLKVYKYHIFILYKYKILLYIYYLYKYGNNECTSNIDIFPREWRYINGLSAPDAQAYGAI